MDKVMRLQNPTFYKNSPFSQQSTEELNFVKIKREVPQIIWLLKYGALKQ